MVVMDVAALQAEIEEINVLNGWRDTTPTFNEAMMLVITECSEAVEAWRSKGLEGWSVRTLQQQYCPTCATWEVLHAGDPYSPNECPRHPDKPEGVPSEFADIVIRVLDDLSVYGLELEPGESPAEALNLTVDPPASLPDAMFLVSRAAVKAADAYFAGEKWMASRFLTSAYWQVHHYALFYGINLGAEVKRKLAYNRTRGHRHGGKLL